MSKTLFSELPLSSDLLRAIEDMGFESATPIQAEAIPPLLEGNDLLGQAQTGTGKTCAFGVPVIEKVDPNCTDIQYLILSPTRELAMQITDELHDLAKYKESVRVLSVYGGQPIEHQIMALKKRPQIIVGTPGRVLDHIRRKTLRLGQLRGLILDEADEMLNMGFKEDIDQVLESTPPQIQRVCFSATMPKGILSITQTYLSNAVHIQIEPEQRTVVNIEQFFIEVRENQKQEILIRLVEAQQTKLGLIFCNTKRKVDELYAALQNKGLPAEALHGDMKQLMRTRVMNRFKSGEIRFLVATDVAARGIDVDDIDLVVNYDLPQDEEYYVHRIGRTGRAGRSGTAITLVVGYELIQLRNYAHRTQSRIEPMDVPTVHDLITVRTSEMLTRSAKITSRKPHVLEPYSEVINKFLADNPELDLADLTAALLRATMGDSVLQARDIDPVIPFDKLQKEMTRQRYSNSDGRNSGRRGGYGSRPSRGGYRPGGSGNRGRSQDGSREGSRSRSERGDYRGGAGKSNNRSDRNRGGRSRNGNVEN